VGILEDSYDCEGMMEAGQHLNDLVQAVSATFSVLSFSKTMNIGSGGCRVCAVCKARRCTVPFSGQSHVLTGNIRCQCIGSCCSMWYAIQQRI